MHSSKLRGSDFNIYKNGEIVSHPDYFSGFTNRHRLGIVTPNGTEGIGAAALLMAHITAFYDTYRAKGEDFFAYPSFYSFQSVEPLSSYTVLDIWPKHKDVWVENDPVELLHTINDRAINILLLPDGEPTEPGFERPQIECAMRTLDTCYLYSADGSVENSDLSIELHHPAVIDWAQTVFTTHDYQTHPKYADQRVAWAKQYAGKSSLKQSYRNISPAEALTRL